ncbi:hypothetical protein CYMTET_15915 [Cymbomonas tetramitiformis]|uniref:F-box domain-containing protein n=1 Tax=Cymbomonas tetramitiformis TaxID=36881 RepID=A0AAE0L8P6_9CHLO|nr:hypothetical protein CYMTET_15915 [Cymbomonas tetramitiformis]
MAACLDAELTSETQEDTLRQRASPILSLLEDVQAHILSFLDGRSLSASACTCTRLRRALATPEYGASLWRSLCYEALDAHALALHVCALASGGPAASKPDAAFWRDLWWASERLPDVGFTWWKDGATRLKLQAQAPSSPQASQESQSFQTTQFLARAGHTATVVDDLILYTGGMERNRVSANCNVLVLDIQQQTVWQAQNDPDGRARIAVYGGYEPQGTEFGRDELYEMTVLDGGRCIKWRRRTTTGVVPLLRYHLTLHSFDSGRTLVLHGGDHGDQDDATDDALLALNAEIDNAAETTVYFLEVASGVWRRHRSMGGPGHRTHHFGCVYADEEDPTREYLVLAGGSPENSGQFGTPDDYANTQAHVLDLRGLAWTAGSSEVLPPPRIRTSGHVVGHYLLLVGGWGERARFLTDTWALDLRTRSWRPVHGHNQPLVKTAVCGGSVAGLVAFGGITRTPLFGIMQVCRTDIFLLGDQRERLGESQEDSEDGGTAAEPSSSGVEMMEVVINGEVLRFPAGMLQMLLQGAQPMQDDDDDDDDDDGDDDDDVDDDDDGDDSDSDSDDEAEVDDDEDGDDGDSDGGGGVEDADDANVIAIDGHDNDDGENAYGNEIVDGGNGDIGDASDNNVYSKNTSMSTSEAS